MVLWLLITMIVAGCGSGDSWMPLKVHHVWTYRVRAGFERHTVPVRVAREVAVASTSGYELSSPLGISRIAWHSGRLVADSMVNSRFVPPIPLLIPDVEMPKDRPLQVAIWHGRVYALGVEHPASAVLTEQYDTVDLGTKKVPTILATLELRLPSGKIELRSWYQSGVGLVQQEQRTNKTRIVQLTLVGH